MDHGVLVKHELQDQSLSDWLVSGSNNNFVRQ